MEKWTYNGVDLTADTAWGVGAVVGGIGTPGMRGQDLQIPFENGERPIKKRYQSRLVMLIMWVAGNDVSTGTPATNQKQELQKNIDTLLKTFGKPGILQHQMESGEIREARAEVYRPVNIPFEYTETNFVKFGVELKLADPLYYATTATTGVISIASSTQQQSITNPGTAPTSYVTITMEGPLDAPRITNAENDIWVQYQGSINAGETVVINAHDYTCLKGVENYISALAHGGDAKWVVLEAGANALDIETGATGGDITIEFYPAYF